LVALEDVVEACSLDHCPDIISWVEAKKPVLAAPPFSNNFTAVNQVRTAANIQQQPIAVWQPAAVA
jgi:hypothetical protein